MITQIANLLRIINGVVRVGGQASLTDYTHSLKGRPHATSRPQQPSIDHDLELRTTHKAPETRCISLSPREVSPMAGDARTRQDMYVFA